MIIRLVLDDARQLDAVEPGDDSDGRLDPDPRQFVLEHKRITITPRGDQPCRCGLARGTKRVQVADVRLVLEREQLGYRLELERRLSLDEWLGSASAEAVQLVQLPVDDAASPERQRVDERPADAERLPLDVVERPVELFVADEHVPVHLVARAAADRVVRVVAQ